MLYLFQDTASGALVEAYFPMAEAPELGSVVEVDGRALKRLPSQLQAAVQKDPRHIAYSLRQKGDTPEHLQKLVPHWTDEGPVSKPVFHTVAEIRNFEAATDGAFNYGLRHKLVKPQGTP